MNHEIDPRMCVVRNCWVLWNKMARWGRDERSDDSDRKYCHDCVGQPPPREKGERSGEEFIKVTQGSF